MLDATSGPGEEVDLPGGDEETRGEEQGVTGQEREEQPALDEEDDEADPEQLGAEWSSSQLGSIQRMPRAAAESGVQSSLTAARRHRPLPEVRR